MRLRFLQLLFVFPSCIALAAQSGLPELAQLKLAAERGEPKAQYEYGRRIASSNPRDSFDFLLKSANQGYGPAEDAVGAYYARQAPTRPKERATLERLAVRYTSRAAFKGIYQAQGRLSHYYERGIALPKTPHLAYGWMAAALKSAGGPKSIRAGVYRAQLNQIIGRISSAQIKAGQQFADEFKVGAENFVELDVLVAQMKITAFYTINEKKLVVVNQTRIAEGETKPVTIDGEEVALTCSAIEGKTAKLRIGSYFFIIDW